LLALPSGSAHVRALGCRLDDAKLRQTCRNIKR
jgi:hypothetical protein